MRMAMPDLDSIYDRAFFEEWGRNNRAYVESASKITDVLWEHFRPKRLVDLGCGCGVYSELFRRKGAEVVAIDGVLPPREESFPVPIELRDLTAAFENEWGEFDLALCLEVAEHIPERLVDPFLRNIARFSDTLVLSCAPPNQGGKHHVNEQPKRYWVRRLADRGFAYNRKRTGVFLEKFKAEKIPHMWMCQQLSVYERA